MTVEQEPSNYDKAPKNKIILVKEIIEDRVFLSSPFSNQSFPVSPQELLWLNAVAQDKSNTTMNIQEEPRATLSSLLSKTDGSPTTMQIVTLLEARATIVEKVNALYGDSVVALKQEDVGEVVTLPADVSMKISSSQALKERSWQAQYGHPSTLPLIGARALHKVIIREDTTAIDPAILTDHQARVMDTLHRNNNTSSRYAGTYVENHPTLSRAILDELKKVYKDVDLADIDWITQGECIGLNPGNFTSKYQRRPNYRRNIGAFEGDVCSQCPVTDQCFDFAIRNKAQGGLWGGLDEKKRKDRHFTEKVNAVVEMISEQIAEHPQERRSRLSLLIGEALEGYLQDLQQSNLYKEQLPAMQAAREHFSEPHANPNGYIVMPTGTGKTVLFTEFIRATNLKTIVLEPTQQLVDQTVKRINEFHEHGDVGKVFADEKNPDAQIVVSTYNSFLKHVVDNTGMFNIAEIELIVLDEAHKTQGKRSFELLSKLAHLTMVGFTATDEYDPTKLVANLLPNEVYRMETYEGIDLDLICPYQTIIVEGHADLSGVKISPSTKDFDEKQLPEAVNIPERNQLALDIYEELQTKYPGMKAVFFCAGVEHAKEITRLARQRNINSQTIYGKLPKDRKKKIFEELSMPVDQGGIAIITNDKILAEGIDEPTINASFNLRPTLSKVVSRQRVGRILRKDPNNPNKIAINVEFIDDNAKKPPYLFPDPEVAKHVAYGGKRDISELLYATSQPGVTTNLAEIATKVSAMSRERRAIDGLPPYDWVSLEEVLRFAADKAKIVDEASLHEILSIYNTVYSDLTEEMGRLAHEHSTSLQTIVRTLRRPDRAITYVFAPEHVKHMIEYFYERIKFHNPHYLAQVLEQLKNHQ